MGILSGKDLFSNKWITAEITDVSNRLHLVPIKYRISEEFFLTKIDRKYYCFKIDPTRIKIYYHTAVRSFRVLQYDTNHYLPVSAADVKELAEVLEQNSLPNVDNKMMSIMKLLGKREKNFKDKQFAPHDIVKLLEENEKHKGKYANEVEEVGRYLKEHLKADQIVTPVRKISEFLDYEINLTDPAFADTLLNRAEKTEKENKKMTNQEQTGKKPWIMMAMILGVVCVIIGVVVWGITSGAFNGMIPQFGGGAGFSSPFGSFGGPPSGGGGELTASSPVTAWIAKYPTPQSIQQGIDSHAITCQDLPKQVHDMVDTLKPKPCP